MRVIYFNNFWQLMRLMRLWRLGRLSRLLWGLRFGWMSRIPGQWTHMLGWIKRRVVTGTEVPVIHWMRWSRWTARRLQRRVYDCWPVQWHSGPVTRVRNHPSGLIWIVLINIGTGFLYNLFHWDRNQFESFITYLFNSYLSFDATARHRGTHK